MAEIRTAPRRLADLNPEWFGSGGHGITENGQPALERKGIGVMFDCPCGGPSTDDHNGFGDRIAIFLVNPLDGNPPSTGQRTYWRREGETFSTLSLSPSIHLPGHWHGWVRDGMVVSC